MRTIDASMARQILAGSRVGLIHGWILDGAGPARWGWAIAHPTGARRYLARTWAGVVECLATSE
jgi:hypothetical protein